MPKTDNNSNDKFTIMCPSVEELSVITNNILCVKCGLVFNNEPRFRMHDARVHKKVTLEKTTSENVRYHCPVKSCIYSATSDKYFTMMKYIKQHYLKVHAEKIYPCSQCPKSFSTEAARNAHLKVCGINFICVCQKVFNSYEALLTHAKRNSHVVNAKYKALLGKHAFSSKIKKATPMPQFLVENEKPIYTIPTPTHLTPVYLLVSTVPKVTCNVSVQTEESTKKATKNVCPRSRNQKTQQTQTNLIPKKKRHKKNIQTQTVTAENMKKSNNKVVHLFPENSLHDFQDFWEDKKICGTQTSPPKNIFDHMDEDVSLNKIYQSDSENYSSKSVSSLDPLLTENNLKNTSINSSSIETQTDTDLYKLLDDSDELSCYFVSSSNNETQTTEVFDHFEPSHIYSNMYTQTCDNLFSNSLSFTDIQTQTKSNIKSEFDCPVSHHMETQTNLLHMFDDFDQ